MPTQQMQKQSRCEAHIGTGSNANAVVGAAGAVAADTGTEAMQTQQELTEHAAYEADAEGAAKTRCSATCDAGALHYYGGC